MEEVTPVLSNTAPLDKIQAHVYLGHEQPERLQPWRLPRHGQRLFVANLDRLAQRGLRFAGAGG